MAKINFISDNELVGKLRKDDMEAFDQIFNRYGNRLYGFSLKYLKSREESEELVQDVFLKVWENRTALKTDTSLKSYLFTIAYHNICRVFRKRKIFLKYLNEVETGIAVTPGFEEQADYREAIEKVYQLVEQLPEKQKKIFLMSRTQGKTTKEISEEMKLSPGTIDNNISSALRFLRKQMTDENLAILLFYAIFIR